VDNVFGIPVEDIVFCMLHARIRITIKMLERTLMWANDNRCLARLVELVKAETNLELNAECSKDGKTMEFVNMTGDRCDKLLKKFPNIVEAWVKSGGCDRIGNIWIRWQVVNNLLSKPVIEPEILPRLQSCIDNWASLLKSVWTSTHVTPYVHIIHKHAVDIVTRHKSLYKFSQEGFEACHRWHRILYTSCTNHNGYRGNPNFRVDSMHMLLTRIYRLEFLELYFFDNTNKQFVSNLLQI